jgi:small subunit ribosomal protein S3
MAHKVHPKAYRLKESTDWDSRWLNKKQLPEYLEEDFEIRKFLENKLGKMGIEKIEIERFPGKITVFIFSARPGLIIGRGGEGIEKIKKDLEKLLIKKKPSLAKAKEAKKEIRLEIKEIKDPWSSASLAAKFITQQIEKRMPHRRVLKQALDKISASKGVQGCRVEIAGRLGGAEIARREWLKKGKLPRQTLRADIDYAVARAFCTYGVVGVKVWIYKGEKF